MTLFELNIHLKFINDLCQSKGINTDHVEIYAVDSVLFDTPSGTLLSSKKPLITLQFKGEQKQLLFYDPTSAEQNKRSQK